MRALFGGGCGLYGEEELESSSDEMKSFVWFDRYIMLRAGYPSYVLDAEREYISFLKTQTVSL